MNKRQARQMVARQTAKLVARAIADGTFDQPDRLDQQRMENAARELIDELDRRGHTGEAGRLPSGCRQLTIDDLLLTA